MVRRLRAIAAFVILASGLALWPSPAPAAIQELKLDVWPATWSVTATNGTGSHSAAFIGLDYRYTGASNWGFHLKGDIASEGGWVGPLFGGARSGTDSIWSGDVFYAWPLSAATIRGFAGYGQLQFSTTFGAITQTLTSNGYRVGVDAAIPIPATPLSVNASVAWYPSDSSTFNNNGAITTAGGNATDASLTFQYNWSSGWLAEAGYRWVNRSWGSLAVNCPCSDTWSGPIFSVGKHW